MEKNIYDLLIAIVPSLIVLLGTVLGVMLSNRANAKRTVLENTRKIAGDTNNMRREKLEELFSSCHQLFYLLTDFHWFHVDYFGGKYTRQELNDKIFSGMNARRDLFTRIEVIVGLYFPELREKWKAIENEKEQMDILIKNPYVEKTQDRKLQEAFKIALADLEDRQEEFLLLISDIGEKQGLTMFSS